jgi:serine O-acetyltransferase
MWRAKLQLPARMLAQLGRFLTGIEIHPGATIGRRFFIDHGMGVVIGETAEIGDDVMLYHGVTLGGTSLEVGKRHPTIGNDVIIGAGAKVIGPVTVHRCARVGSNAVVVKDVDEGATVVGIPAKVVGARAPERHDFVAYGMPGDLPDPVQRAVEGLLDHVSKLQSRIDELEERLEATAPRAVEEDEEPRRAIGGT